MIKKLALYDEQIRTNGIPLLQKEVDVKKRFKIALVWPKGFDPIYSLPLPYGYFMSNIDKNYYDVQIFDNALQNLKSSSSKFRQELKDFNPDLVAVSTWSPMYPEALSVLQVAKELNPNVVTIMGGVHVSSYADKIKGTFGVDFLMRGEAEHSFPIFLDELQKKNPDWTIVKGLVYKTMNSYQMNDMDRPESDEMDQIKIPDYNAIQLKKYLKAGYRWNTPSKMNSPIWATRGCPYRCQYCASPELNGRPVRTHSIKYMMEWIKYLYYECDIRWINILDDNFTFHVAYAKDFCRAVIDLGLKDLRFGTPNGIRLQRGDPELWKLMKKAGWETLIVAPESGSQSTLELMKKDLKDVQIVVPEVVKDIRKAGLKVQGFFIIGYPGEKPKDLDDTLLLIRKSKFNFVFLNNFQPLVGTPVYDELVKKGEIEDGLLPKNYSAEERAYTPESFKNFNFSKFILKTHLMMMLTDPLNIPYQFSLMLKLYSPRLTIKKFSKIVYLMIFKKRRIITEKYYQPMHMQEYKITV